RHSVESCRSLACVNPATDPEPPMPRARSLFNQTAFQLLLVMSGGLAAVCAHAAGERRAPVTVSAIHGEVKISSTGGMQKVSAGATLSLPATIRTGVDGAVELRQGDTIVSAAANAQLDIPASAD